MCRAAARLAKQGKRSSEIFGQAIEFHLEVCGLKVINVSRYLLCAVVLVVILASHGCGAGDFAAEYAIAKLDLPNGRTVFFKREVRGINGNYDVVAISSNGDACVSVNKDTDYCICSGSESIYYKLEGDTLHLYYATANHAPAKQFPIKVVNHEVHPMDAAKFMGTYGGLGITRLDLAIDHTKKCR